MKVFFTNELEEDSKKYEKIIKKIFRHVHDKHTMNIIFVSKDRIQQINRDYRKIDRVTDVISFALFDNDECMYEAEKELGDIFICVDRAIEQAQDYGHSIEREVGFLSVHGYLHLKGYDHQTEEQEKEMFSLQEEILQKAKLKRGE
jgi:probable rRNA maturation factor